MAGKSKKNSKVPGAKIYRKDADGRTYQSKKRAITLYIDESDPIMQYLKPAFDVNRGSAYILASLYAAHGLFDMYLPRVMLPDSQQSIMHRPPHEVIPYQRPEPSMKAKRPEPNRTKEIAAPVSNPEEELARASNAFLGMFG